MRKIKIRDAGYVFNGNSINAKVKKEKYCSGKAGLPYIATKDLTFNGEFDFQNGVQIPLAELDKFKIAKQESVLICAEGGSAGKKIGFLSKNVCFGNKLFAFEPSEKIKGKYVYYYFLSKEFQKDFKGNLKGIIGGVSLKKFKQLEVPLIPLDRQNRIVSKLDKAFEAIDQAIANTEKNIENIEELRKSHIKQIWEKLFSTNPILTLGESCEFKNGGAHEKLVVDEGYILVNSKFISSDGIKVKFVSNAITPLYKDDIAFVMSDVPNGKALGKAFLVDKDNIYTLNQRIGRIKSTDFIPKFLFYQINRNPHFLSFNNGENQTNLRKGQVLSCPLVKPNFDIQSRIIEQIDDFESNISSLLNITVQKRRALNELKMSILEKAFKGELV